MLKRNFSMTVALACLCAGSAWAADEPPFVSGGIGLGERSKLEAERDNYNVHLTFANRGSGAYRSDVDLAITDKQGKVSLHKQEAGPWVFVQLAPGRYQVKASSQGRVQERELVVSEGAKRDMYFYWEGKPESVQ